MSTVSRSIFETVVLTYIVVVDAPGGVADGTVTKVELHRKYTDLMERNRLVCPLAWQKLLCY